MMYRDSSRPKVSVFPLESYSFLEKTVHRPERDLSTEAHLTRLQKRYDRKGCVRTVESVLLVHCHSHPHVLLLQEDNGKGAFRLPGGKCRELETDLDCLRRKLKSLLGRDDRTPPAGFPHHSIFGQMSVFSVRSAPSVISNPASRDPSVAGKVGIPEAVEEKNTPLSKDATLDSTYENAQNTETDSKEETTSASIAQPPENQHPPPRTFHVAELLAEWTRPNFESLVYPYCPPHVTSPKEIRRIYLVHMPQNHTFLVPKNMKLFAVPLFELYDNTTRFGSVVFSNLPQSLSRFDLAAMS